MKPKTKPTTILSVISLGVVGLLIFAGQATVYRERSSFIEIATSEKCIFVLVNIARVGSQRNALINPFAIPHKFDGKYLFCSISEGSVRTFTHPKCSGAFFPERDHSVYLYEREYRKDEDGQYSNTGQYYKCTPSDLLLIDGKPMGKKTSDFRVGLWPGDHYESTCNRGKDTCSINVANTVDFLKITHQYNRLDEHRDEVVYFSVGQDVVELFRAKRGETTTWRYQPY